MAACRNNAGVVSNATGIPRPTLIAWKQGENGAASPEVQELVAKECSNLADMFQHEAEQALLLAGYKRKDASYKDLMSSAGMAAEKSRLLRDLPPPSKPQNKLTDDELMDKILSKVNERKGDADTPASDD